MEEPTIASDKLDRRVWVLAAGRFVSMIGSGFTAFYAPVFFVNTVHITPTFVGFGIAANSVAGIIARIIGGTMADSPKFGRVLTLVMSSIILAVGSVVMGMCTDFIGFFIANTLLGFGIGLYWPGAEAMIADITTANNRRNAFAVNRFADYGGLGIGVVLAGLIVQNTGAFRILFFVDAVSYVILTAVIFFGIKETQHQGQSAPLLKSWSAALKNPLLQLYVTANILMTAYITQISSSLPLYLTDSIQLEHGKELSPILLSALFAGHVIIAAASQLPVAKAMNHFTPAKALIISCGLWLLGFVVLCVAGLVSSYQFLLAAIALVLMSIATVAYGPPSSALIVDLAPPESRAIYFSINSLCWAMGGLIGPPAVLAAMEHFPKHTPYIWLVIAATTLMPALVFRALATHDNKPTAPVSKPL